MLKNYSCVRLESDRFQSEGAFRGDVGYIIETYNDDAYEIEFSNAQGITIAQIVACRAELELTEEHTAEGK